MEPFLSIIIPAYNRGYILQRAIDSVLNQSFYNFEVIVVDDGSTDDTQDVLSQYIKDKRVRYLWQENKGVSAARNFGVAHAGGDYIILLDSDDCLQEGYMEEVNKGLNTKPDIVFVGARFYKNQMWVKDVLPGRPYGKPSDQGLWLAGTFAVRRNLFLEAGGYDPAIRYGENTEISIRLSRLIKSKIFIEKPLLEVNQAAERISASPHNLISSISYTLKKHKEYYDQDRDNKRVFLQIMGVACFRIKDYKSGRKYFWQAYGLSPFNINNLIRFIVSFFPLLVDKLYSSKIS